MRQYCYCQTPIGKLMLIGRNGVLEELLLPNTASQQQIGASWQYNAGEFGEVRHQLGEYFSRQRQEFNLTISPKGTVFQEQVWKELQKIPFATTTSYGAIAKQLGKPKACRAVGMANGRNPLPIIIPCHRVIGKDGSLTGFAGGLSVKKQLLALEGVDKEFS